MAEKTAIGWTDHTSNAWIGCTKVSPGCDNCYAEQLDLARFSHTLAPVTQEVGEPAKRERVIHWGVGAPRYERLDNFAKDIAKWNAKAERDGVRRRVFVNSLSDFFDNEVPWQWRDRAWGVMRNARALDFQLLTKRIGLVPKMLPPDWILGHYPNVWIGASIVDQAEASRDLPKLIDVRAAVRFVSYEPALGPVEWRGPLATGLIHWVIVGGESKQGGKCRTFDLDWAHSTVNACRAAKVPVFVKQLGSVPIFGHGADNPKVELDAPIYSDGRGNHAFGLQLKDRAGANPAEWPKDLRVQEFPA